MKWAFVYLFSSLVAIPVYVKHNISFRESSSLGRFEITVGPKQTMGKTVEGVIVTSQMPKGVLNMSLTPSQGTHTFDPVTKVGGEAGGFESLVLNSSNSEGALQRLYTSSKGAISHRDIVFSLRWFMVTNSVLC